MSDCSCFVKSFYKVALKVTLGKTYWTQNCSVWKELTRIEISLHSLEFRMLERGENVGNNLLHVFLDSRIIQWATSYSLLYWKRCGGLSLVCGLFFFFWFCCLKNSIWIWLWIKMMATCRLTIGNADWAACIRTMLRKVDQMKQLHNHFTLAEDVVFLWRQYFF